MKQETRNNKRLSRVRRIRAKVSGVATRPRVRVFRSLTSFYAQVIDDVNGKTVVQASLGDIKGSKNDLDGVKKLGEVLAKKCLDDDIKEIVFDRAGYKYHGKVKVFAEALRSGGLKF